MEIIIKQNDDITMVSFIGRLDTVTSPAAEAAIAELLDSNHYKLLINLAETEWVSSSGLRVFLVAAKRLSALKGKLKICSPNVVVREILDISGFSTILDIRASEKEAHAELLL